MTKLKNTTHSKSIILVKKRAVYGARSRVDYVPTQEEMLEEAKETELYNLESLRMYQLMELEKKASHKKVVM